MSVALAGFIGASALFVRLVGEKHHFPMANSLIAAGAVASPIVAYLVASRVTSRTIASDTSQRTLEREQPLAQGRTRRDEGPERHRAVARAGVRAKWYDRRTDLASRSLAY